MFTTGKRGLGKGGLGKMGLGKRGSTDFKARKLNIPGGIGDANSLPPLVGSVSFVGKQKYI